MCNFLLSQGQPIRHKTNDTIVFSFPQEAPEGAMVAGDLSAVEHLRLVLDVNKHWCDHNASATIYVGNDEWVPIGELLRERVGEVCGITFLPRIVNTGAYPYMPLEEVVGDLPPVKPLDWLKYAAYDDSSFSTKGEFACMGGSCEITI